MWGKVLPSPKKISNSCSATPAFGVRGSSRANTTKPDDGGTGRIARQAAGQFGPRLFHAYDQLKNAALFEGLLPLLLVWLFALVEAMRKGLPSVSASPIPCASIWFFRLLGWPTGSTSGATISGTGSC
jgi:hypothetical protein